MCTWPFCRRRAQPGGPRHHRRNPLPADLAAARACRRRQPVRVARALEACCRPLDGHCSIVPGKSRRGASASSITPGACGSALGEAPPRRAVGSCPPPPPMPVDGGIGAPQQQCVYGSVGNSPSSKGPLGKAHEQSERGAVTSISPGIESGSGSPLRARWTTTERPWREPAG